MKYVRPHLSAPGFLDSNSVYVIQSARRNAFVGFLHIYTEAGTFILSLSIYEKDFFRPLVYESRVTVVGFGNDVLTT